ncbi:hypothetical protein INR49_028735, partial [Caranx melampygus]
MLVDSESLDRCIQTALSDLYPPFQLTSPTVLCQVLNVVETCYRGDGLRYLLHFLLPAKQLLHNLQRHACVQHCGVLRLLPAGFTCYSSSSSATQCHLQEWCRPLPRLLLCSVSAGSRYVEQQEVSELALRSLFSMAWLDSVNREREQRGAPRLQHCVLSSHGDVFRVPWEDLVYPQFISQPRTSLKVDQESSVKDGDTSINVPHDLCDVKSRGEDLRTSTTKTDQSPASSEAEDSEGEYVELTELPRFSPQKGSLTQSISQQHRARNSSHTLTAPLTHTHAAATTHTPHSSTYFSWSCVEVTSHTGFCSKLIEENLNQDSRRPVILTPIAPSNPSSSSSSSAPLPEVEESSVIQLAHQASQEQTEGTDSDRQVKLNTEANGEHKREERVKEVEREEKREEGELLVKQEKKQEIVESSEKKQEEEVKLLEDAKCRRDEDLVPHTHVAEEGGEMEEEDESEETDRGGEEEIDEEGDDELEEDEAEEVELEEEVQVVIVQQSQERKEEKVMKKGEGVEGKEKEEEREGVRDDPPPPWTAISPSADPRPTEPEPPAPPPQLTQSSQSSFYNELLGSGALCLPGTRDRHGRALLMVCTWSSVWSNPGCDQAEMLRLLLYYTSTLRKEMLGLGLTVLVDARRAAPVPGLFSALRCLQENKPGCVHTVLLLVNKDSTLRLDKPAGLQRVEQLTSQCEDVINLLQRTINVLQSTPLPPAAEDAELLLSRYKAVMRSVLEDGRLVQLQKEGGACLSRLRREESSISVTEAYRAELEAASSLYEQVDELLHRLVTLSNSRTQELTFILDFRVLEQGFTEVRKWLEEVGEVRLKSLEEPEDSLELLIKKQQDFKDFYTTAYDQCKHGEALLGRLERWDDMSSADLHSYEVKVHTFWAQLQDFSQRVNTTGQNIDRAVILYRFLDQAYGWALEGMRHLAGISMEECTLPNKCQAVIDSLEDYQRQHPSIPDTRFQDMKAAAGELRGERGLCQWSFAWSKCQETKKMFDRKMEAALRTRDSAHRRRSDSTHSRSSISSRKSLSGFWGVRETSSSSFPCTPEKDTDTTSSPCTPSSLLPLTSSPIASPPAPSTSSLHTPQHTPLLQRLFRSVSSDEASDQVDICSSPSLPRLDSSACSSSSVCSSSSFSPSRRQQLRKTQSFDCPPTPEVLRCPRTLSEPVRRGNTGVFIRGLEVSSTEAADRLLCPRVPAAPGWVGQGLRSPGTPGTPRTSSSPTGDTRPRGSKLRHIVEEMVTTEREYVRSLRYIIHHYFPEMDRVDLPQDLRGKRSVVFGNLEKLLDFHIDPDVVCVSQKEQFGLYALYSKNKPKSDALLLNHGNSFFRRKQVELGDKMDLSSYLLKPIQRMSKYALLLTDLSKEVGIAQEAELTTLQAATDMVKFQLRHGNDLLAMDAIRDCDVRLVNLKEQGQLIRQDEFTVWTGRRKCQRHIFLFEELVLFSKPKKMEGGLDVFIYKHSFKTADVGLTESTGDSGLKFEIWFRRRTAKNQTFILQAPSQDIKLTWTCDIARILWTQATRNKEMRLKEMVSMGVGNKPFLDIQPSDAAISDRAVHCIMKSRGARTRASIAVSVFDHSNPFKRAAVTSDPGTSGPSSSSLLGPLNLHMYSQTLPPSSATEGSFSASCIEEDEQEHETSSQPSMTTESSGSSSRCLSGSTGSDSGCVSAHLQEALPEEPRPSSQPSSSSSSSSNKQLVSSQYMSAVSVCSCHQPGNHCLRQLTWRTPLCVSLLQFEPEGGGGVPGRSAYSSAHLKKLFLERDSVIFTGPPPPDGLLSFCRRKKEEEEEKN